MSRARHRIDTVQPHETEEMVLVPKRLVKALLDYASPPAVSEEELARAIYETSPISTEVEWQRLGPRTRRSWLAAAREARRLLSGKPDPQEKK